VLVLFLGGRLEDNGDDNCDDEEEGGCAIQNTEIIERGRLAGINNRAFLMGMG